MSGNYCVDRAVTDYLVTARPPAKGTVCQPAGSPFGRLQARMSADQRKAYARLIATTLPDAVRRALAPPS
jgi:hypothetical protein